jgi:hypothetical protein
MPPAGLEPAVPANERSQAHALDRAAPVPADPMAIVRPAGLSQ